MWHNAKQRGGRPSSSAHWDSDLLVLPAKVQWLRCVTVPWNLPTSGLSNRPYLAYRPVLQYPATLVPHLRDLACTESATVTGPASSSSFFPVLFLVIEKRLKIVFFSTSLNNFCSFFNQVFFLGFQWSKLETFFGIFLLPSFSWLFLCAPACTFWCIRCRGSDIKRKWISLAGAQHLILVNKESPLRFTTKSAAHIYTYMWWVMTSHAHARGLVFKTKKLTYIGVNTCVSTRSKRIGW